ncbi:MAG: DUF108 domain-containing protein [Candidatus Omnitrophica bacterium]|nr:DUF108 domain-containing protein [Candidatus Omnitrophota bacterium]
MVRVGLVGCGTIGSRLALALQRNYRHLARITALHDLDRAHALRLRQRLRPHPPVTSLKTLIQRSDVVLEAASASIAAEVAARSLRAHRDVLVMSVGGLLRDASWRGALRRSRGTLHIPSGALAGLDGIKAMAVGRLRRVTLTTRKPPSTLASAPGMARRRLRLGQLTRPVVVFEGSPRDVVRAFPQNTNVAAALTLAAGVSASRPRVRVVADPAIRRNIHEVEVEGDCGRIQCRVESCPSANPKTSELAVRSAIVTLGRLFDRIQIGT